MSQRSRTRASSANNNNEAEENGGATVATADALEKEETAGGNIRKLS